MKTAQHVGWALSAIGLCLPFSLACSANASSTSDGGSTITRNDGGPVADASSRDAGAIGLTDALSPASPDAGAESDRSDPGAFAAGCLDGMDENRANGVDCSDPSCSGAASCCVGVSSTACCATESVVTDLHFVCGTGTCSDLTGLTAFGDVGPVVTADGAYAPESDHGTDSGAISGATVDPRAAVVTLTAQLAIPSHTSEVDAVAIGLVAGGPSAHVVPLAALVVSASRQRVLLLLGETVAGSAPAPTDGALHDYTMRVEPSGRVTATADGISLVAMVPLPTTPLHAAFFGRATNPGTLASGLPARIGSLRVTTSDCDQPAALTRLGPVSIVDHTSTVRLDTATDPSLASDGTTTALAFAAASTTTSTRAIFVATREADGAFHVRQPATGTQPILVGARGDGYESPALAYAAGQWFLYATRVHAGARSIALATSTTDALSFGAPAPIAASGVTGELSSPAPVPGDPMLVIARRQPPPMADVTTQGPPELVLLSLDTGGTNAAAAPVCGADSSCADGARAETHLYTARTTTIRFDADDVDDPAIVLYDHVYRLYYAGRLGSRWSIGMLIAADLHYWRAALDGDAILAADGDGFDAVSVRGPAPLVEDGHVSLYYVGNDGDVATIALAQGGAVPP